ncbi:BadF/BadG/BcrA/BcrD ATPase family protein [Mameliella sediminis]|uniref:BadF/BadG/BcrA/BcrD ATPase family protein n=1 Tax=Mameliella sediminis TaxID=2836866 RepID=UPI001C46BFC1|nr:BadF/BadG/BcrA/BcrD ATPase family protein [Mameliella sediminis]MBV7394777.1 ATPase [Mameliella sediminis]
MSEMDEFLVMGVDGGGSGCRAVIARRDGPVLGHGRAGPANATTDPELAIANARAAIEAAVLAAGLTTGPQVAHLGLAGALTADVQARIADGCGVPRATVSDDLETALAGALGAGDGILVSVGTGSVLAGRKGGAVSRIGGWGLQVSDQASGAWLGRCLMERVLLCHDGLLPHSELTRAVLDEFTGGALGIVAFASHAAPGDFAALAPRIVSAAGADLHAGAILGEGADYLSQAIRALDGGAGLPICLTGGLGPAYAPLLGDLSRRIVPAKGTALDGALQLARAAAERLK